mmetsp:Transcript_83608/g.249436  ORF Transcript_83608/g.249436 Transcript_83608/m.249436 type:complete len:216 (-) Transcript_83608:73-720(-)
MGYWGPLSCICCCSSQDRRDAQAKASTDSLGDTMHVDARRPAVEQEYEDLLLDDACKKTGRCTSYGPRIEACVIEFVQCALTGLPCKVVDMTFPGGGSIFQAMYLVDAGIRRLILRTQPGGVERGLVFLELNLANICDVYSLEAEHLLMDLGPDPVLQEPLRRECASGSCSLLAVEDANLQRATLLLPSDGRRDHFIVCLKVLSVYAGMQARCSA